MPAPSLGHPTIPMDENLSIKRVNRFRVSSMTCTEKHPGLCRARDSAYLGKALALAQQLSNFVGASLDSKGVGQALMCFSACYAGENGVQTHEHHRAFLCYLQHPR